MRKLNDQWVEDGRMYKAIEAVTPMSCARCDIADGTVCCSYQNVCGCKREPSFIIKDLGRVDKNGFLAEERTGLFPSIYHHAIEFDSWYAEVRSEDGSININVWGDTLQEAIDAWNRRTTHEKTK